MSYVLISPARNEAAFIELTLKSVIAQTLLPLKWVIVSDGSTDGTDEIVKKYVVNYNWIELVRIDERKERDFSGKVFAFNAGYDRVRDLNYSFIGSLDGDISFAPNYFQFLIKQLLQDQRLGVVGTPFKEGTEQYDYRFSSRAHVSGACQLFRRKCFEDIGGYVPIKEGGVDLVAVVTARMKGWRTWTFTDMACVHHRKMGSAKYGTVTRMFRSGYHDYLMGVHPIWQIVRAVYQMGRPPIFVGGLLLLTGFFYALAFRAERPVSKALVEFRRREQMQRLRECFTHKARPVQGEGSGSG